MSLLSRTAGTKWSKLSCRPSLIVVNTTRTRAPLPRKLTTPSSNMEPGSEVQDTRDVVCLRYVDVGSQVSRHSTAGNERANMEIGWG